MEQTTQQPVQTTPNLLYVPNSSEKKRAIMMYLFFGIMVWISKKEMDPFEYFHLKQASGRRIFFFLVLIIAIVMMFLPLVKYIVFVPLLVMVIARGIFMKQAWDGKYSQDIKQSAINIFAAIGWWLLNLFEIEVKMPNLSSVVEIPQSTPVPPVQVPEGPVVPEQK